MTSSFMLARGAMTFREPKDCANHEAEPPADGAESWSVRIRHPLECRPFRPEQRPFWSPKRRDRRDAGRPIAADRATWTKPRLVTDKRLGAVRVNFRYAAYQSMTAAHSEKAGRDQYFEGPHETYGFRKHEIGPFYLDLQYQGGRLEWETASGNQFHMTFDWIVETQDHGVVVGEDKASDEFFKDPDLEERLDFAEAYLETIGATLERRVAGGLPTRLERRIVKDIFDARRTRFTDTAAASVREMIEASGGTATLNRVIETIGGHPVLALDIARAMMHRRVLEMPLSTPPMPDTPVTAPPHRKKSALRDFLAQHIPA
ncbi:hypothetical protein [uncultured Sphingomonas sp.]|uniref:hypothetical protein n=1 Tax=uncultured Sphingomonas sp. TaxID=158754 RepID=UPI0025D33C4C|nr:hypothetical protein [uncultured Sphingomonas sp.]